MAQWGHSWGWGRLEAGIAPFPPAILRIAAGILGAAARIVTAGIAAGQMGLPCSGNWGEKGGIWGSGRDS